MEIHFKQNLDTRTQPKVWEYGWNIIVTNTFSIGILLTVTIYLKATLIVLQYLHIIYDTCDLNVYIAKLVIQSVQMCLIENKTFEF